MKKIIVNGSTLVKKEIFGVQRNTLELLRALDSIAEKGEITLAIPQNGEREISFTNIEVEKIPVDCNSIPEMKRWNLFGFTQYANEKNAQSVDLILSLPVWGCDVVAVYDCITERFIQNANSMKKRIHRLLYMARVWINLKRARIVITDSISAKNDLMKYYGIPGDKIKVIYCGWQHFDRLNEDDKVLDRLSLKDREFFFSLGSRYYHKNYKWIVEAAKQNPQYKFVISGSSALSTSDDSLNEQIPNLIYAGYLKDEEVKALMKKCKAFIHPSLYEGFGLPPLEAMSVGAKCIVSNVSSLPEIYGRSVWYIDPYNYNDINLGKIMMEEIEDNSVVLNKYSWNKSAELFYKTIKGI